MNDCPSPGAPEWAGKADERLDASGLRCPEPLMLLRNRVRELPAGSTLHLISTDPASERDFERFCAFLGHRLLERARDGDALHFLFRKKGGGEPEGRDDGRGPEDPAGGRDAGAS